MSCYQQNQVCNVEIKYNLKIAIIHECVCVSASKAASNYSHEMD